MGGNRLKNNKTGNNKPGNGNIEPQVDDVMNADVSSAPCAVCEVIIPGDGNGVFCDGFCRSWYHPNCVNIDDDGYENINKVISHVKWYCEKCSDLISRIIKEASDVENYVSLLTSINELTKIVKGLTNVNNLNTKRIDEVENLLTQSKSSNRVSNYCLQTTTPNSVGAESIIAYGRTVQRKNRNDCTVEKGSAQLHANTLRLEGGQTLDNLQNTLAVKVDTKSQIDDDSKNLKLNCEVEHESENRKEVYYLDETAIGSDYQNKVKDGLFNEEEFPVLNEGNNWKTYNSRKHRRQKVNQNSDRRIENTTNESAGNRRPRTRTNITIFGKSKDNAGLEVAGRVAWIFVSRLKPTVEEETVKLHTKNLCGEGSEVYCEKLRTKYNTYSSFKVGCQSEYLDKLLNEEAWPEGVIVCKYIPNRASRSRARAFMETQMVNAGNTGVPRLSQPQSKNLK
jgi:hypothetical protein